MIERQPSAVFGATRETKTCRDLTARGVAEVAAILCELLREDSATTVTFAQIVRRRLGLPVDGDGIPFHLARAFAVAVEDIGAACLRIKEAVEDTGRWRLSVVDSIGYRVWTRPVIH